jgi:O-antigen/teichoic acid export membrane protein
MRVMKFLRVLVLRGLGGGAGFLATLVAARLLGAHDSGLLFLALAIVTVGAGLSRLGADLPVVRFVGSHADNNDWTAVNGVVRLALVRVALAATACALLLFLFREPLATQVFSQPELADILMSAAWLIPVIALYWLHAQAFIGTHRAEIATLIQNAALPVCFIAMMALTSAYDMANAPVAALCYLLSGIIVLFLAALMWWKQPRARTPGAFDKHLFWHTAAPLWSVAAMNMAVQWSGQLAAGALLTPVDVAHLAASQRTAMLIGLSLAVTNMVVAPRFSALHHRGDQQGLKQLARQSSRLMLLVATPVAVLMALLAPWVMGLFGDGFVAATTLLLILLFGQWINALCGSVGLLLSMSGHERDLRNITLISGGLAILLAVLFTLEFGAAGTAWATALAIIVQNIMALVMVKKRLGFWMPGR